MSPHVLVADDDGVGILRMVANREARLQRRDRGRRRGCARARAGAPCLLITDVMMPKVESLVRQLRSRPAAAGDSSTALSSEDDCIRGFRLGARRIRPQPFRFEELDLRVAKTLRRTAQSVQEARDGSACAAISGRAVVAAALVLVEMSARRSAGPRVLDGATTAQVLVRDGKVVHARLDHTDEPVDAECVPPAHVGRGEIQFVSCVVEGVDCVNVSTTQSRARLMDEERADNTAVEPIRSRRAGRGEPRVVGDGLMTSSASSANFLTSCASARYPAS